MTKQMTINGNTYNVLSELTIEEAALSFPHLAAEWRKHKISAQYGLQLPGGKVAWVAERYQSGNISSLRRLPGRF